MDKDEAENKRIGVITSLGVHGVLVLIFISLMAWRAPNPPNPEFGIELNFGMDDQGTGEIQPQAEVGEQTKETAEEVKETPSESQLEEVKTESKEEAKDVSDKTTEQLDSKLESPVTVKEEKKEVKSDKKEKEKPTDKKKQEKLIAEFKKEDNKETATDASKKGDAGNQGDDKKKTGDKGSEEGKLDAKALYGTPGGGDGGAGLGLAMNGWVWDKEPIIPELPDNENGKVEFEIECDENGDIIGIVTKERSLSPKAEQLLKDEIRKNSLRKISDGKAPEKSKGRITFILKTK